mmetsp:Transcript_24451/g.52067  ORF Transcript_24451/g.52067 Transcript_24451/m.52067 type:complete len:268 (+) Transcript_24451:3-806(+)
MGDFGRQNLPTFPAFYAIGFGKEIFPSVREVELEEPRRALPNPGKQRFWPHGLQGLESKTASPRQGAHHACHHTCLPFYEFDPQRDRDHQTCDSSRNCASLQHFGPGRGWRSRVCRCLSSPSLFFDVQKVPRDRGKSSVGESILEVARLDRIKAPTSRSPLGANTLRAGPTLAKPLRVQRRRVAPRNRRFCGSESLEEVGRGEVLRKHHQHRAACCPICGDHQQLAGLGGARGTVRCLHPRCCQARPPRLRTRRRPEATTKIGCTRW